MRATAEVQFETGSARARNAEELTEVAEVEKHLQKVFLSDLVGTYSCLSSDSVVLFA